MSAAHGTAHEQLTMGEKVTMGVSRDAHGRLMGVSWAAHDAPMSVQLKPEVVWQPLRNRGNRRVSSTRARQEIASKNVMLLFVVRYVRVSQEHALSCARVWRTG